jgi:hypothetical protein
VRKDISSNGHFIEMALTKCLYPFGEMGLDEMLIQQNVFLTKWPFDEVFI